MSLTPLKEAVLPSVALSLITMLLSKGALGLIVIVVEAADVIIEVGAPVASKEG